MLQICFGTYLVLGLPAILVLWMALSTAKMHDLNVGSTRQRHYRLMVALSNLKNAKFIRNYDLMEDSSI